MPCPLSCQAVAAAHCTLVVLVIGRQVTATRLMVADWRCSADSCMRVHAFGCMCGWLQVKLLKDLFRQALGDEGAVRVDINTIDGFQVGGPSTPNTQRVHGCFTSSMAGCLDTDSGTLTTYLVLHCLLAAAAAEGS